MQELQEKYIELLDRLKAAGLQHYIKESLVVLALARMTPEEIETLENSLSKRKGHQVAYNFREKVKLLQPHIAWASKNIPSGMEGTA